MICWFWAFGATCSLDAERPFSSGLWRLGRAFLVLEITVRGYFLLAVGMLSSPKACTDGGRDIDRAGLLKTRRYP